jgi:hypothetical protein
MKKPKHHVWSEVEIEKLTVLAGKMPIPQIAKSLCRSRGATAKAFVLRLSLQDRSERQTRILETSRMSRGRLLRRPPIQP